MTVTVMPMRLRGTDVGISNCIDCAEHVLLVVVVSIGLPVPFGALDLIQPPGPAPLLTTEPERHPAGGIGILSISDISSKGWRTTAPDGWLHSQNSVDVASSHKSRTDKSR